MPILLIACKSPYSVMTLSKAIKAIEKRGVLLVYPIHNAEEPRSLWSEFYPNSKMRWEWDNGADGRVASLWLLREELSRSGKVVYAKWYKGRATFFSKEVFSLCYSGLSKEESLSLDAKNILETLLGESPLSTKALKKLCKMEGRYEEKTYNVALRDLWSRLLVVGFGEVDDGAFPSLAVGATQILFEELTHEKPNDTRLRKILGETNPFLAEYRKQKAKLGTFSPRKDKLRKTIKGKDLQLS